MMGILSGSPGKSAFLSVSRGLHTVYCSGWEQECVKHLFARGEKEESQLCKRKAGYSRPETSTQLGKSELLCGKRKWNAWMVQGKGAQAPGLSAGKTGGECICTEGLVLMYFRARQTSAHHCSSMAKHDRNDTSYSRTSHLSQEKPGHSALSGLGLEYHIFLSHFSQ